VSERIVGHTTHFPAVAAYRDLILGRITLDQYRAMDLRAVTEPIYETRARKS